MQILNQVQNDGGGSFGKLRMTRGRDDWGPFDGLRMAVQILNQVQNDGGGSFDKLRMTMG